MANATMAIAIALLGGGAKIVRTTSTSVTEPIAATAAATI